MIHRFRLLLPDLVVREQQRHVGPRWLPEPFRWGTLPRLESACRHFCFTPHARTSGSTTSSPLDRWSSSQASVSGWTTNTLARTQERACRTPGIAVRAAPLDPSSTGVRSSRPALVRARYGLPIPRVGHPNSAAARLAVPQTALWDHRTARLLSRLDHEPLHHVVVLVLHDVAVLHVLLWRDELSLLVQGRARQRECGPEFSWLRPAIRVLSDVRCVAGRLLRALLPGRLATRAGRLRPSRPRSDRPGG